jgi:CheY-like chemotaxis protein
LRFLLVEELKEAGYQVFEAEDASKAINILEAHRIVSHGMV